MPPGEIRAVLAADPIVARRLLELHRERLEEWVEEQRALLSRVERAIVDQSVEWRSLDEAAPASTAISAARR
jgi:hypothetical protein